jgi:hypothetical protein
MIRIGRARRSYVVFLVSLVAACCASALTASAAFAGPIEGVTNTVGEVVGEPVREVVETVTPPVQEVTETATAPVQEVTETATAPVREVTEAPPGREVTEAATAPVEEIVKEVPPPVKATTEAVTHPSPSTSPKPSIGTRISNTVGGAVSSVGSTARKTEGVSRTTKDSVEDFAGGALPASKQDVRPSGSGATGAPGIAPAAREAGPGTAAPPRIDSTRPPRGAIFFPPPSREGATGAPLPRWMSYIWPAIALTRPVLANLLARSEPMLRAVLAMSGATQIGGPKGPVVAGVHSSGGRPEAAKSPSPSSPSFPFSKITSAVGDFPYNSSGAALGYIVIVAIMLIALFVAVRWEIAHGRREGRG